MNTFQTTIASAIVQIRHGVTGNGLFGTTKNTKVAACTRLFINMDLHDKYSFYTDDFILKNARGV